MRSGRVCAGGDDDYGGSGGGGVFVTMSAVMILGWWRWVAVDGNGCAHAEINKCGVCGLGGAGAGDDPITEHSIPS